MGWTVTLRVVAGTGWNCITGYLGKNFKGCLIRIMRHNLPSMNVRINYITATVLDEIIPLIIF